MLRRYSFVVLERLVALAAAATFAVYVAYAAFGPTSAMAATVPFVAGGLIRYQRLSRRHNLGEEPEEILLTDPVIRACVGGWILTAAVVLLTS